MIIPNIWDKKNGNQTTNQHVYVQSCDVLWNWEYRKPHGVGAKGFNPAPTFGKITSCGSLQLLVAARKGPAKSAMFSIKPSILAVDLEPFSHVISLYSYIYVYIYIYTYNNIVYICILYIYIIYIYVLHIVYYIIVDMNDIHCCTNQLHEAYIYHLSIVISLHHTWLIMIVTPAEEQGHREFELFAAGLAVHQHPSCYGKLSGGRPKNFTGGNRLTTFNP